MAPTNGEPSESRRRRVGGASLAGFAAAVLWVLLCVRWFDPAAPWRPAALTALPPLALALPATLLGLAWLRARWGVLAGASLGAAWGGLLLVLVLAFFFRLPIVTHGAAAAVTPDGALSGIVALHVRDGLERLVFVPHVPYSGSLKSHLTAPLAALIDPARAFALVSVLFYLGYVAGLHRLALLVAGPRAALLAGLYAAFSPAFLTRYSVSNDGNYVEVLALGTWAIWLAARWTTETNHRPLLALATGWLLGLAFWCHILAVIHIAAVAAVFVVAARIRSSPSLAALAFGSTLGYVPGLLWNAANGWLSFQYLLPGEARAGETGLGVLAADLGAKLWAMLVDGWPVLLGYDSGYGPALDGLLRTVGWLGVAAATVATVRFARRTCRARSWPLATLLLFAALNVVVALLALPHVPGIPRYLLFLMSVLPVFLADAFGTGWRRLVLLVLIAAGALSSFAQVPGTLRKDARWRDFVADLQEEGVRWCYTDFHLATLINFVSQEAVVCTAKLGPVTTEYFFAYREQVERAPEAAFVAVNRTSAAKLGRRLKGLGVSYERRDLMKPVLLRLNRKVDPEELFPGREFPWR
jgi:hypothetical protein